MSNSIPADRLQLATVAPRQYAAMARFSAAPDVDPVLAELVKIRASLINGCAFCVDMHWKDARAAGESEERLYSLTTWHEARVFDARERAALALCDAVTEVAQTQVPDDVWERAAAEFSEQELAQLVFAVAAINSWNRLCVATRTQPGHYEPGMFGAAPATA